MKIVKESQRKFLIWVTDNKNLNKGGIVDDVLTTGSYTPKQEKALNHFREKYLTDYLIDTKDNNDTSFVDVSGSVM